MLPGDLESAARPRHKDVLVSQTTTLPSAGRLKYGKTTPQEGLNFSNHTKMTSPEGSNLEPLHQMAARTTRQDHDIRKFEL